MYPSLMHAELAVARQHDLIAAAVDHRLAQQARLARLSRHAELRSGTTQHVRRTWVRSATQTAHS